MRGAVSSKFGCKSVDNIADRFIVYSVVQVGSGGMPGMVTDNSETFLMDNLESCGTRWRSWLRYCTKSRKVAGSIPDGVIGNFHRHNPSGRTMALGLTHPLTEMSTTNIFWKGKGGRCVRLTILPPSCTDCLEILEPKLLEPSGTVQACNGGLLYLLTWSLR